MLAVVQGKIVDLNQVVCENRIQVVQLFLIFKNLVTEGLVPVCQGCRGNLKVSDGNLSHIDNFLLSRVNGKRRRL